VSESFGTLGAEALESRCRRLWRVFGVLGFIESWCGRLSASTRFGGLFGVRSPECSERAAPTWLIEQVSGRLESSGRFAVSETRWRNSRLSMRCRRAARASGCVRVVKDLSGERHERLFLGNREQRSGKHLEEQQTRGGERSRARFNRRPCDSRLCMEKSLVVEELGARRPIRRSAGLAPTAWGQLLPMREGGCAERQNP
jgi:hypothetical protein